LGGSYQAWNRKIVWLGRAFKGKSLGSIRRKKAAKSIMPFKKEWGGDSQTRGAIKKRAGENYEE